MVNSSANAVHQPSQSLTVVVPGIMSDRDNPSKW